jgi:predicted HTH domain antitoxin
LAPNYQLVEEIATPIKPKAMPILIPDDILLSYRMSEAEMKLEIAVMLFQKEKLTLAQASRLAEMPRIRFQHLLASRDIPVHCGNTRRDNDENRI